MRITEKDIKIDTGSDRGESFAYAQLNYKVADAIQKEVDRMVESKGFERYDDGEVIYADDIDIRFSISESLNDFLIGDRFNFEDFSEIFDPLIDKGEIYGVDPEVGFSLWVTGKKDIVGFKEYIKEISKNKYTYDDDWGLFLEALSGKISKEDYAFLWPLDHRDKNFINDVLSVPGLEDLYSELVIEPTLKSYDCWMYYVESCVDEANRLYDALIEEIEEELEKAIRYNNL